MDTFWFSAEKRAKVLQKAKALAKQWESSVTSSEVMNCTLNLVFCKILLWKEKEKITMILQQLMVAHQSTMVEQLLVEYNIAQPCYVKQAEFIGLLISDLYTDAPELVNTPGECAFTARSTPLYHIEVFCVVIFTIPLNFFH